MTRKWRGCAVVCVALVLFGACGGDDDDKSLEDSIHKAVEEGELDDVPGSGGAAEPGELPDPCALVTQEDAERLFGEPAEAVEDTSPVALGKSCLWKNVGGEDVGNVAHLLQVHAFEGEQFYGVDAYEDVTELDDLGDRAFVHTGEGLGEGVDVEFVDGGTVVSLAYSTVNIGVDEDRTVDAADRADTVVQLARQAGGRL